MIENREIGKIIKHLIKLVKEKKNEGTENREMGKVLNISRGK